MIKPYPFQAKLITQSLASLAAGIDTVTVLVTGGGKSVIIGAGVTQLLAEGKRVLVIAHKDELVSQLSNTMSRWGHKHAVIGSDTLVATCASTNPTKVSYGHSCGLAVGMAQTVVARMDAFHEKYDVIITDEAHHLCEAKDNTWVMLRKNWPNAVSWGLTATPIRSDNHPIFGEGGAYSAMVHGPTGAELVAMGLLAPLRKYCPTGTQDGRVLVGDPVEKYLAHGEDGKGIVFASSIKHSKEISEKFNAAGIPSAHIDGKTKKRERVALLSKFRNGEIKILCNYNLFTEGFDVPDCSVVILARRVGSYSLYAQMIGRAGRMAPGKQYGIVIDLGENSTRLEDERTDTYMRTDWTIQPKGSTTSCPRCEAVMYLSAKGICPQCTLDTKRFRYCYHDSDMHGDYMCHTRVRPKIEGYRCGDCDAKIGIERSPAEELQSVDGDLTLLPDHVKLYFESLVAESRKPPKISRKEVANYTNAKRHAEKMERAKIIDEYVRQINGDLIKLKPDNYTLFKMFYDVLGDKNQYHLRCMIKSDDELDQALTMATEVHLEWLHGKTIQ